MLSLQLKVKIVLAQGPSEQVENHSTLIDAVFSGNYDEVDRLLTVRAIYDNAATNNNEALRWAARYGYLAIVDRLLTIKTVRDNAAAERNEALRWAARDGHLAVVDRLLTIKIVRDNAAAEGNEALRWAASDGYLTIVERLLAIEAVRENPRRSITIIHFAEQLVMSIKRIAVRLWMPTVRDAAAARDNEALRKAARHGHLEIVEKLLAIEAVRDNAAAVNNEAFREAAGNGHLAIVDRLLAIEAVRDNVAADGNGALRWAASGGHLATVERLLTIETVRDNAAAEHNEALSRAVSNEHFEIVARLLNVPAVRAYLEAHRLPIPGALAHIAQNQENSMRALSSRQEGGLVALKQRYQEEYDKRGQFKKILEEFRLFLEEKLKSIPMALTYDGSLTSQAAYYENDLHTAWRYLFCDPNLWMSPDAEHVRRNSQSQGAAILAEPEQETIAYLWLLVTDNGFLLPEGMSREELISHFIKEISLIGRAHNWDKTRKRIVKEQGVKVEKEEYYDDKEGDKPSCPSGISQRLVQMLELFLSNYLPEYRPLSMSILKRDFMAHLIAEGENTYFSKINQQKLTDLKAFKAALDNFVVVSCGDKGSLPESAQALLASWEMSKDQIEDFLIHCQKRFGEKRITEKLETPIIFQEKTFASYDDFLYDFMNNVLTNFYPELETKLKERIAALEKEEAQLEADLIKRLNKLSLQAKTNTKTSKQKISPNNENIENTKNRRKKKTAITTVRGKARRRRKSSQALKMREKLKFPNSLISPEIDKETTRPSPVYTPFRASTISTMATPTTTCDGQKECVQQCQELDRQQVAPSIRFLKPY